MSIKVPSDFLTLVRAELADTVSPYLWSDTDLYFYMSKAQEEWARETKCLKDYTTWSDIPISSGEEWIDLDPKIIDSS